MNNTTDFIAKVYDTLANIFGMNGDQSNLFLQMAWPGIPLSPADFKNAGGLWDTNVASETFSEIANIAPVFSKSKFEDSAYNIEDLYEIILASARPNGVPNAEMDTNPFFKLFANAQFEFLSNEKGSVREPNVFYHPAKATPNNWYDESATQFWPKLEIKSTEITKADQHSVFVKNNGLKNLDAGVWRVKPDISIKNKMLEKIDAKVNTDANLLKTKIDKFVLKDSVMTSAHPMALSTLDTARAVRRAPLATVFTANPLVSKMTEIGIKRNINSAVLRNELLTVDFKKDFDKSIANNPIKIVTPTSKYKKNIDVLKGTDFGNLNRNLFLDKPLPFKKRMLIENILIPNLTLLPATPETNGFNISFNFCRVNIERPWFKLELLSMPNWYIYGSLANTFSNGSATDNQGIFPLLTTSFIVIKNLKITANWSETDKNNISNGVSFGPFDIRRGTFNQGTLEIPGMQILAFFSKITPALAPVSSIDIN